MGILNDLIVQETTTRRQPCTVERLLSAAGKDRKLVAEIQQALTSDVSATVLAKALNQLGLGVKIGGSTVRRHRRRECACP